MVHIAADTSEALLVLTGFNAGGILTFFGKQPTFLVCFWWTTQPEQSSTGLTLKDIKSNCIKIQSQPGCWKQNTPHKKKRDKFKQSFISQHDFT